MRWRAPRFPPCQQHRAMAVIAMAERDVHSHNQRGKQRGVEAAWDVTWATEALAMVMRLRQKHIKAVRTNGDADRPRFSDREQLPLPSKPPYTAHLGNLTYDVTSADIEAFLGNCQVTSVRIVEDKIDHKPKGFGYVEFATLDGLKTALTFSETNFMGRNVKISIAEPRAFTFIQCRILSVQANFFHSEGSPGFDSRFLRLVT